MKQIEIQSIRRQDSYIEISVKMTFTLPTIFGTGTDPIDGVNAIVSSYPDGFYTELLVPEGTVIGYSQLISLDLDVTVNQIKNKLESRYSNIRSKLDSLVLKPLDLLVGLSYDGTNWV